MNRLTTVRSNHLRIEIRQMRGFAEFWILKIDGRPVADIDLFEEPMEDIVERKAESLVFQVLRGIHRIHLEFEPSRE